MGPLGAFGGRRRFLLLCVTQFAVTRVAHPEGKQSKRKGTGTARALAVRWERPSSAAVHVQREKHEEQTESSEPTVSPQPTAASPPVRCRGAAWGHSRSSRDLGWTPPGPPQRFAPTALHRGRWPARDKHRSPFDVEEGSCPKESIGHPGAKRP